MTLMKTLTPRPKALRRAVQVKALCGRLARRRAMLLASRRNESGEIRHAAVDLITLGSGSTAFEAVMTIRLVATVEEFAKRIHIPTIA